MMYSIADVHVLYFIYILFDVMLERKKERKKEKRFNDIVMFSNSNLFTIST